MRFLRVNSLVVCCSDEGRRDGPALVFINSLGTDLRIWDDVARILSPDFRIVRYDKRGHGLSELGPDRCDMADYARDLAALMDALDVKRATLVGLSIGGLIAQELYRQRPKLFAALVLSDTAAKIGTDEFLGRADRRGRARRDRGDRQLRSRALVHRRLPDEPQGRARRLAGDADADP